MKIINKLERKFGRFGIPHLTNYILVCYVIGYLLSMTKTSLISYLYLEPGLILQGQIWRLITWVLVPPGMSNILFVLIMLMFYYSLGTTLERTWGTFRYTLYIFSGLLFTVIGAFLLYFIEGGYVLFAGMFSTYYISMSILLAFAVSYPDMRVLLYFVIPIKMKWMAFVYVAMIGYDIFFFLSTRDIQRYHPKEVKRRQEFKKAVNPTKVTTITKHKCAVCGRTERDGENLEFRFCSKCNGNYEYCQDHLYTHEHVK